MAYNNKEFNSYYQYHKRHNTPLYQNNNKCVDNLLHFSYVTTRQQEYRNLIAKRDRLLAKLEAQGKIEENEKITPSEAHLIDSFQRGHFLPSLERQANWLRESSPSSQLANEWIEIARARNDWHTWGQNVMLKDLKGGDILIESDLANTYHGRSDAIHSVMDVFTEAPLYHASVYFTDMNASLDKVPSESHVIDRARSDALELGTVPMKVHLRIDPSQLLTEAGKDACTVLGITPPLLQQIFEYRTNALHQTLHEEIARNPHNFRMKNGTIPLLQTWMGYGKLEGIDQKLEQIPNQSMACSQFAAYATLAALSETENLVLKNLRNRVPEFPIAYSMFRPLIPKGRPWTPAGLYFSLRESGAVEHVRSPELEAVFQTPQDPVSFGLQKAAYQEYKNMPRTIM